MQAMVGNRPHFINRGVGGNRVADFYARWDVDAISLKTDLISILIGVKRLRMMSERPGNCIERAYRHLLAETKKLLPFQDWCCTSVYIESWGDRGKWEEWLARTDR